MRGDQLARQWRILKDIEASLNGLTAAEISQRVNVSVRTAYRDLSDLQMAGFPLYSEKKGNGQCWKFVDSYSLDLFQSFSFTELMALHLSKDLFKIFHGTFFFESLESLFGKILETLPSQAIEYLNHVQSTFHTGIKPYKEYDKFREIITQLYQAAMECRSVEMAYQSLGNDSDTVRKLSPYRIWFYDGTIYIIGFCHLRAEIRTFVLDRIKMLTILDETFTIPGDFDVTEYMRHSFRVMHDELYKVKIRITPSWAKYMGEKIWHESQETHTLPDGSLEMTFHVAGLTEISRWIMSLGPEVVVVEPENLKLMIADGLRNALAQYEDIDMEDSASKVPQKSG
jgi:predicted DNA-binding transcriptional regulator YafY